MTEFYTVEEVCKMLRVSRVTFYTWIKKGKIKPTTRIGRSYLFAKDYIDNLVREGGFK